MDGLHSRQNSLFTRDTFQAWASGSKEADDSIKPQSSKTTAVDSTASSLTKKKNKPFVAAAAFPDDIASLVEVEFAAFQHETVNHVLSYRDASNPEHTARTVDFYKYCMQHIRTTPLPDPSHHGSAKSLRSDSKVDLATITQDETETPASEGYRFRKVIDPSTREIIAFCKSEITTLTPADHASPLDAGHESEAQMNRDWFALNEKLHRKYCGMRQHLCTSPREDIPNLPNLPNTASLGFFFLTIDP
jgi:hypothetical protein